MPSAIASRLAIASPASRPQSRPVAGSVEAPFVAVTTAALFTVEGLNGGMELCGVEGLDVLLGPVGTVVGFDPLFVGVGFTGDDVDGEAPGFVDLLGTGDGVIDGLLQSRHGWGLLGFRLLFGTPGL